MRKTDSMSLFLQIQEKITRCHLLHTFTIPVYMKQKYIY